MNYFITGGSGFIGTHLTNLLKERFPHCHIYNLDIVENSQEGKVTYIYCDVRKPIHLEEVTPEIFTVNENRVSLLKIVCVTDMKERERVT